MRLHCARHAESEANVIGGLHCSVPGPGLSPRGFDQAEALALELAGHNLRAIYSSAMTRSQQTAAVVAARLGLQPTVLAGLHETHLGDLDCRVDDEAHQLLEELFTAWMLDDALNLARPGGETGQEVLIRMRAALDEVVDRHGAAEGEVLVVGHGAALRLTLSRVCEGVSPAFALRHYLPNTARVVLDVQAADADAGWRLVCRTWAGLRPEA